MVDHLWRRSAVDQCLIVTQNSNEDRRHSLELSSWSLWLRDNNSIEVSSIKIMKNKCVSKIPLVEPHQITVSDVNTRRAINLYFQGVSSIIFKVLSDFCLRWITFIGGPPWNFPWFLVISCLTCLTRQVSAVYED